MTKAASAVVALVMLMTCGIYHCREAFADLLQCGYPNTYFFFDVVPGIGRIQGFVCNAPVEDHGQHWHAELGGGGVSGNIGGNIAVPGLQGANGGLPIGISVTIASATWRCPDERYESNAPDIVGTWNKERPKPLPCKPVRPAPLAFGAPWPPTDDVNVKRAWPPESNPVPVDGLPPVPPYGSEQEQAPVMPPSDAPPLPNTKQGG